MSPIPPPPLPVLLTPDEGPPALIPSFAPLPPPPAPPAPGVFGANAEIYPPPPPPAIYPPEVTFLKLVVIASFPLYELMTDNQDE